MLRITIYAVGKLKEPFWRDACQEYQKRLKAYCKLEIREIPDSSIKQEAQALHAALPSDTTLLLLDIQGDSLSSEQFADLIEQYALGGHSRIAFIIGGSDGIDESIEVLANKRLSFGAITLPHNLARVVLLEQIYRAFKIIRNEPYHK